MGARATLKHVRCGFTDYQLVVITCPLRTSDMIGAGTSANGSWLPNTPCLYGGKWGEGGRCGKQTSHCMPFIHPRVAIDRLIVALPTPTGLPVPSRGDDLRLDVVDVVKDVLAMELRSVSLPLTKSAATPWSATICHSIPAVLLHPSAPTCTSPRHMARPPYQVGLRHGGCTVRHNPWPAPDIVG